jgi:hypothetical protein
MPANNRWDLIRRLRVNSDHLRIRFSSINVLVFSGLYLPLYQYRTHSTSNTLLQQIVRLDGQNGHLPADLDYLCYIFQRFLTIRFIVFPSFC